MKRNRILYLSLLLLSIGFLYFYGGKVPYALFHTVLFLPIVSAAYMVIIFFRFKYKQDIDRKFIMKGEKVNFIFSINNEDIFPYPYIRVIFFGSDSIFEKSFPVKCFSLLPFQEKNFSIELMCKYRGFYEIGIKAIEIEDFLGIIKLRYNINESKYVTVHPKIVFLDNFYIKTNFVSESHVVFNSIHEDMTTVSDIRKYAYGDSFKRIHWKLTAKSRELMVKNFQNTSETNTIIILDLKKNPYTAEQNAMIEDKVIESTVAVTYYCLSNWVPINLVYYNNGIVNIEAKNPLDFDEIYRILSKISFSQTIDLKDIIDVFLREKINKTNIIVFTSNMDYDLYNQIHKTKFSGYELSVAYISPEEAIDVKKPEVDNILTSLPEIGVDIYKVNINDELKAVFERYRSISA